MKKQGFTLIELLAVIVILAIIALIAVPIIMNVIKDSQKGAFKNSAYGISKAAEMVYMNHVMDGNELGEQIFRYSNFEETNDSGLKLEYKGQKPEFGEIILSADGNIKLWLWRDGICAIKGENEEEVMVDERSSESCGQASIPPTITIEGYTAIQTVEITRTPGELLNLPNVTASDSYHNDLTSELQVTANVDINTPGIYQVVYTVTDANYNTKSRTITVIVIDNIAPNVTFTPNGDSGWKKENGSTVVVEDANDVDSSSLKYLWTSSTTAPLETDFVTSFTNNTSIYDSSLTKNGTYYLWVLAKDNIGNTAIVRSNEFRFDTTGPVLTAVTLTATNVTETGFTITRAGNAYDSPSGLVANPYTYQISMDGTNWTNVKILTTDTTAEATGFTEGDTVHYRVCALDHAQNGNCSVSQSVVIQVPYNLQVVSSSTTYTAMYHANGRWIAVGTNGGIATSTDGENWTHQTVGTSQYKDVYYGNNRWIAVGASGVIATSTDGENWTSQVYFVTTYDDVNYANGRWVVVGNGRISYSTNGTTWTSQSFSSTYFHSVEYANGRWIAVGTNGGIATSTDGTTWTTQSVGSRKYDKVYYANGRWIAVGVAVISTSTNGTTWSFQNLSNTGNDQYKDLYYGNTLWVAVAGVGTISTSTNGTTWNHLVVGNTYYNSIIYVNNRWIALGTSGYVATSTDGINWVYRRIGTSTLYSINYVNNKWVAAGGNGTILSTDTLNWLD